jgi:hypothetical protein
VKALITNLNRFLEHRPMLGIAPSPWTKFSKLIKRHQVESTLLLLTAASLIVGTIVSATMYLKAAIESDRANSELASNQIIE